MFFVIYFSSKYSQSFYGDLKIRDTSRDLLLYSLVLIPPTLIAIINPNIFMGALDFAGTYGISILFGIFPPLLAYVSRNKLLIKKPNNDYEYSNEYQNLVPGGNISLLLMAAFVFVVIGVKVQGGW